MSTKGGQRIDLSALGGQTIKGLRPHFGIMDEMTFESQQGARSLVTDEHGNVIGQQWSANPVCKECGDINDHHGRPHSEAARESQDFLAAVRQMAKDPKTDLPALVVRQAEIHTGATVMVMWGEARGMIGVVTGQQDGGCYVTKMDGPGTSGLYVPDSLGVVLSEPPAFADAAEAEDWLLRSGEQEWFPGDVVRVSERRDRETAIQHGRIVKYLGIQGKEPPKYLIDIHGEPKITASYFIKGRA